ncbi:ParA family protein [Photobacterium leiognathi]|uniref:ParA family protein n=1 Tax=Photobacterium leiognathi TaxID=553611 RepID=UPI0034E59107
MGKIILLGSQKGGCGKSTLAVNVAGWLVHQGHNVILADADPQASCRSLGARPPGARNPKTYPSRTSVWQH